MVFEKLRFQNVFRPHELVWTVGLTVEMKLCFQFLRRSVDAASGFSFSCERKTLCNRSIRKRWRHDNHVISLIEFSSNTNPKWPVIVAFLNSSGVLWTENIWCVFRVKSPLSNSSGVRWMGPQTRQGISREPPNTESTLRKSQVKVNP